MLRNLTCIPVHRSLTNLTNIFHAYVIQQRTLRQSDMSFSYVPFATLECGRQCIMIKVLEGTMRYIRNAAGYNSFKSSLKRRLLSWCKMTRADMLYI